MARDSQPSVCTWSEYLAQSRATMPQDGAPGALAWGDDYLAAMLAMLGRNGYAPRITPAGGLVCEPEAVPA
jgi:hypothetical protein